MNQNEKAIGYGTFVGCIVATGLILMAVYVERDFTKEQFGQSRFEVAEKIKRCEADLARNQRCKVIVTVEKP